MRLAYWQTHDGETVTLHGQVVDGDGVPLGPVIKLAPVAVPSGVQSPAPPLPEHGCTCSACRTLRDRQLAERTEKR